MAEDKKLAKYIERLLGLKDELNNQAFSPEDFKQIAKELGLDEEEWQKIQQIAENYYLNGQAFLEHQNWEEALKEFDKSLEINPYHEGSLLGKVKVYTALKQARGKKSDEEELKIYAQRLLKLKPGHPEVVRLLSVTPTPQKPSFFKSQQGRLMLVLAFVVAFLIAYLSVSTLYPVEEQTEIIENVEEKLVPSGEIENPDDTEVESSQVLYNEIIDKRETVYQQWAQVENVYQRRSDLISEILSILKQSGQLEQKLLDKVLEKQKAIKLKKFNQYHSEGLENFNRQQTELKEELNQLLEDFQNVSTLKGYRDLQVQIEGAENRIAVERRKYNRLVGDYNRMIQKYPYRQFNFETIAYFKQTTIP